MKRLLKVALVVVVVLAIIVGALIYFGIKLSKVSAESKNFVEIVIVDIGKNWNSDNLMKYASDHLLSNIQPQEATKFFEYLKNIWSLVNIDKIKCFPRMSSSTSGENVTVSQCAATATCRDGAIRIIITISKRDDVWKVDGFHLDSPPMERPPTRSI